VAHRVIDGRTLLLSPSDHALLTLNDAGQVIWRRLSRGPVTANVLARLLAGHFGIPAARAAADVDTFLCVLTARRLIVKA
jgi:hypothetical protein